MSMSRRSFVFVQRLSMSTSMFDISGLKVAELHDKLAPLALTCKAMDAIVTHQTTEELVRLREENAMLRAVVAATNQQSADFSLKYGRLVWFAQSDPSAETNRQHPGHKMHMATMKEYPKEVAELSSEGSSFQHGFNSGMLAASRLFQVLSSTEPEDLPDDYCEEEEGDEQEAPPTRTLSERLATEREWALEELPMLDS